MKNRKRIFMVLAALAVMGFAANGGFIWGADEKIPQMENAILYPLSCACPRANSQETLDQIAGLNWCQLEQLYRQGKAGPLPHGFAMGRVIYPPHKSLPRLSHQFTNLWWKGKHFNAQCKTLINQWLVGKSIRAKIYYGCSNIDGQPTIIMDYAETSWRWRDVRDEMREIAPGLYVGGMFSHRRPRSEPDLFFVIQVKGD